MQTRIPFTLSRRLQKRGHPARREGRQGAKRASDQKGVGVVKGSVGKPDQTHLTPAVAHALDH